MRRMTAWISMAAMSVALVVGVLLSGAGVASAASCTAYPAGCTAPAVTIAPSAPKPLVAPAAVAATTSTGTLAFTGTDVVGTVIAGVVLIGAGAAVVGMSRRRRSA